MIKAVVIAFMVAIVAALGSGLWFLVRDTGDTRRTVKALTWRIVLSFVLIAFLLLLYFTGVVPLHNFRY